LAPTGGPKNLFDSFFWTLFSNFFLANHNKKPPGKPFPRQLKANLMSKRRNSYWGGVWGGFLVKMFLNREKTTPKPTPPF
jgi:hypothetical protein